MMELPMLPLPDLMAAKKTPAQNAVAKARKDLSKAAKVVHAKPERTYAPLIDLGQFSEGQLAELMVAAGDAPGRRTYFDYSEERPYLRDGQRVHLDVGRDSLQARLQLIEGARESIELEFFIYEIDKRMETRIEHDLDQRRRAAGAAA